MSEIALKDLPSAGGQGGIPKAYEPQAVEARWYQFWCDQGCFTADPASSKPAYSIVIPPPNVTGMLHMGHVLNNTIQDILSRKARMDGKEVLWLPGTDHAGIATQAVVEKALRKEGKMKHRDDLGREKFLEHVWAWKEKHGGIIIQQLKKLGCSCDWSRLRFTMDPEYSTCVQHVFVQLYHKHHIYRGKRMVNWCPATQTALSDEEVEMKPQKGFMYHFKVEVAEAQGMWLTIATTRPETIPGDTAVAVNPKDTRYAHLIGKHIVRPLPPELPREQKLIPIVGDERVDFEFGTGVLKVTPAHDKADFDIWQTIVLRGIAQNNAELAKMEPIEILNPDGSMNLLAGVDLKGLDRFTARKVAVEKLKELGAFVEEKPYENNVGFSQRADVPIEPRLSEQWFLKYPSVEQALACVTGSATVAVAAAGVTPDASSGKGFGATPKPAGETPALPPLRFHPDRWAKTYTHWMTNIKDWCISRQLWWGHRIPVWYLRTKHGAASAAAVFKPAYDKFPGIWRIIRLDDQQEFDPQHFTLNAATLAGDEFELQLCTICTDQEAKWLEEHHFTQDPDVLDTWFSSWLWPFATMGWPEQTPTLKKFYPTTDLVTGPDIIFFWVARMIMAGYEFMGEPKFGLADALPFRNVYFTGIIRDKLGRKMSKSLGNSPDPLELIAQYGADALRFGTMRSAPLGQDVLFDEKDVELGRNFCNKLWNACRFRQMQGGAAEGEIDPALLTSDDKWILLRLDQAIREIDTAFADYKFSDATATLYRFFWSEYCDWYVEASKAALQGSDAALKTNKLAVIDFVLSHTLRLFHPFLPFITEELWQGMAFNQDLPDGQGGKTIMFARWPQPLEADFKEHYGLDESAEKLASAKYELVGLGRNLRREFNLPANKKLHYILKPAGNLAAGEVEVIRLLLNAEAVEVKPAFVPEKGTPVVANALGELLLPLAGLIDVAAERARLSKELDKARSEVEKARAKLDNPQFTQKVPPHVLAEHQKRLVEWQTKEQQVLAALANLPAA